jgi:hypothetical protein
MDLLTKAKERVTGAYGYTVGELRTELNNIEYVEDEEGNQHDVVIARACLPHSCDEWVIGGPDQIRALILDLEESLKVISQAPEWRQK